MQSIALFGLFSLVLLYIIQKWIEYRQVVASISNHPGLRTLLGRPLPVLIRRRIPYLTVGSNVFQFKHDDHAKYGCDVISQVRWLPQARCSYHIADADVIKEITNSRVRFPKPVEQYRVLGFFGSNLVMTEGDEWKRQRKFVSPVFSERNNKLVWDETVRIMDELLNKIWATKDTIIIDSCVEELTLPIALFVLGAAAFGNRVSWLEGSSIPPGHMMTFKDALHNLSVDLVYKVLPKWLGYVGLGAKMRKLDIASNEFERYMSEMFQARRSGEDKVERFDILSGLLAANEESSDGDVKLSDNELTGNVFILMVAGHETTAHSLAFAFGLLALHQDVQEELYEHVKTILADGRTPSYKDMAQLTYSMAVVYETLRMFPPVPGIPKKSAEDTSLVTTNAAGEKCVFPVPKGTPLTLQVSALHYNPRYWEDPYQFKPSRFLGEWPRDAFIPFSAGPRACIGRRFTETEAVAVLSMAILQYRVEIKDEPQFAGETFEQKKARVLDAKLSLTLAPKRMPLVFKRR